MSIYRQYSDLCLAACPGSRLAWGLEAGLDCLELACPGLAVSSLEMEAVLCLAASSLLPEAPLRLCTQAFLLPVYTSRSGAGDWDTRLGTGHVIRDTLDT